MGPKKDLAFEPISRETVSAQIREQLLRHITTGEFAPGEQMPSERDLAARFRVARTSVREAMQGLLSLGVVERRGNRSFVAERLPAIVVDGSDRREDFVTQLFETRRVMEVPVFALAAERATDSERRRVAELAARFRDDLDIAEFRRLDREFHTTVAASCGNPLLIELYGKILDELFRSSEFDALLSDAKNEENVRAIVSDSGAAHVLIADAFVAADVGGVERHARGHLRSVEQSMVGGLV